MAIFGLDVSIISRGSGDSVTAAAAYRAGERIVDKRTGEVHDYRRRSGVSGAIVLAPAGAESWTRDRADLWNRVESSESRCDAQLARHWLLVLPRELNPETKKKLALTFFRRYVVSRGVVVDVAFHDLDGANPHCHGLGTLRELVGDGFAARKNRTWNAKDFLVSCREGWATLGNEFLARANVGQEQWIDHRTLEAQRQEALLKCDYERALRLCRLPTRHLGKAATAIRARGGNSAREEDLAQEARAAAPEVARMRREVELHQEQVAQLHGEQELERRLEDRWREKAENDERERKARIEAIAAKPGGRDLFEGKLDDLDPRWRDRDEPKVGDIDAALTHAETELAQIEAERQRIEEQRRTTIEHKEAEVSATKTGPQWLLEARQQVLKGADREPTLDEHEHLAEMAWGRIRADLDRRKESLVATETGARFLRAAQQKPGRGAAAGTLESEEQLVERVELQLRDHLANERRSALRQELTKEPGGRDLVFAQLADIDPAWSRSGKTARKNLDAAMAAAASDPVRLKQLRDVLKDPADAANYRAALAERGEEFTVEDIDAALGAALRQREEAAARQQEEKRKQREIARRTKAIRATSTGGERLDEQRRACYGTRPLTLDEEMSLLERVEQQTVGEFEDREAQIVAGGGGDLLRGEKDKHDIESSELTFAAREQMIEAVEQRLRDGQAEERRAARCAALSPVERELYLARLTSLDPAWAHAGGPSGPIVDRALDETESDGRVQRLEQVCEDAEHESYYRAVLDAAGGGVSLQQVDAALNAAEVFVARKQTIFKYPGNSEHPDGRALWVAELESLAPGRRPGAETRRAAYDQALEHVESQLAERVRQAAEVFEKLLLATRLDPDIRSCYRVPAPSNERLDTLISEDEDNEFYKATVVEVRKRYRGHALHDTSYRDSERHVSEELHLRDAASTEMSSPTRPTWRNALASVLKKYLAKLREFVEVACDKVLGGDLGERLARRGMQVERAADVAESRLPTMSPWPDNPAVPAMSDMTFEQVAANTSTPFVREILVEVGERYKRRARHDLDYEERYDHNDRLRSEERHIEAEIERRLTSKPAGAREAVEAEVFEEHRASVLEVFEAVCAEVLDRDDLGAPLQQREEQAGAAEPLLPRTQQPADQSGRSAPAPEPDVAVNAARPQRSDSAAGAEPLADLKPQLPPGKTGRQLTIEAMQSRVTEFREGDGGVGVDRPPLPGRPNRKQQRNRARQDRPG